MPSGLVVEGFGGGEEERLDGRVWERAIAQIEHFESVTVSG